MIFTRLCGYILIFLLGLANPPAQPGDLLPMVIVFVGTFWGFFVHANVRWRFGPLEWLLATPAFHHWHHTRGVMTDRNYAATLPWLDRMFGTYYMPRKQWPEAYGTDTPVSPNLAVQLVDPFFPPSKNALQPLARPRPEVAFCDTQDAASGGAGEGGARAAGG